MALLSPRLGAKAVISLGRKNDRPDLYAGVMVTQPQPVQVRPGLFVQMAEFIYSAISQATGESYLARKMHSLNFAFDRSLETLNALGIADTDVARLVHDELVDGTPDAPKSWQECVREQSIAQTRFALNREPASDVTSINVADIGEIAAEA